MPPLAILARTHVFASDQRQAGAFLIAFYQALIAFYRALIAFYRALIAFYQASW